MQGIYPFVIDAQMFHVKLLPLICVFMGAKERIKLKKVAND